MIFFPQKYPVRATIMALIVIPNRVDIFRIPNKKRGIRTDNRAIKTIVISFLF